LTIEVCDKNVQSSFLLLGFDSVVVVVVFVVIIVVVEGGLVNAVAPAQHPMYVKKQNTSRRLNT
jgi:ABC-type polysaccharide transport system permease subunit